MATGNRRPSTAAVKRGPGRRPRGADFETGGAPGELVNSVSRALSVLDCFERAERPLGNQEIAQLTGLPKSTISRLTRTLTEAHYLRFRPDLEKYQPGPRILVLAGVAARMDPFPALLQPELRRLADATRGTVGLGSIEGREAVYLQVASGVSMIMLKVDVGTRMPLLGSAMGLALLCGLDESQRSALLSELTRRGGTFEFEAAARELDRIAEELGRLGYCTTFGNWHEGINGVAAPVRAVEDGRLYAINIGSPSFLMDADKMHALHGPRLLETIADLKARGLVSPLFPRPARA